MFFNCHEVQPILFTLATEYGSTLYVGMAKVVGVFLSLYS